MARKKQTYVKGPFTHRRTEADYMGVLLDAVPLEDWREVVGATVAAAKAGDPSARAWLGQYLIGKPSTAAPTPLTVVVQQLSGRDPLVDKMVRDVLRPISGEGLDARRVRRGRSQAVWGSATRSVSADRTMLHRCTKPHQSQRRRFIVPRLRALVGPP
jgi:hypothetical protein